MKTPLGWTRSQLYLDSGPRLGRAGSTTDYLREIMLTYALVGRRHLNVMRDQTYCRASMLSGADGEERMKLHKEFWDSWRAYMEASFPYDEDIRKMKAADAKDMMEKQMKDGPLMVWPLPKPKRGVGRENLVVPSRRKPKRR